MIVQTYVELGNNYDAAISTGVNRVIAAAITNNAETLAECLTIYIIIVGGLLAFGEMQWKSAMTHMLRAVLIGFLLTAEGYNTYIATPAMTTIPNWIAASSNNVTAVNSPGMQFQLLESAVEHQKAALLEQATGLDNMSTRFEANCYGASVKFLLLIAFWVYELSRMIMGLLVATLPFLLSFYLFEATRGLPLRVVNKGVGILILQLMLSIVIQIMITGDNQFMIKQTPNVGLADLDESVGALQDITVFFAFGVFMVLFIPSVAAYVGGGIAVNVGGALIRGAATAATGGAAAAGRAARNIKRRLS